VRLTRVCVEAPLEAHSQHLIRGAAANHITRVLRLRPGAELTLFDGRGGEYPARILELRKAAVLASVEARVDEERESPIALTLAQGVARGERMDFVVQKATELGVRRIVPVLAERSVVRLNEQQAEARLRHWRAIAVAACEQCGRNRLPQLEPAQTLETFLASVPEGERRFALRPGAPLRIRDLAPGSAPVTVLIGPEGGLSEAEQAAATRAGFMPLCLGPRVLRTETAAIAALAALQQQLGDL
jgi:16S rRNA (uracil1498-N3)-methyltransferase